VCTQVGFHWDFEQSIWNPLRFRVILMQSNVGQFRVGKQTIWDLPGRGDAVAAG
jgi:hypothetical protein